MHILDAGRFNTIDMARSIWQVQIVVTALEHLDFHYLPTKIPIKALAIFPIRNISFVLMMNSRSSSLLCHAINNKISWLVSLTKKQISLFACLTYFSFSSVGCLGTERSCLFSLWALMDIPEENRALYFRSRFTQVKRHTPWSKSPLSKLGAIDHGFSPTYSKSRFYGILTRS